MKTLIIISAILIGYFFPYDSFSLNVFLISIVMSAIIGYVFPEMMNLNSLSNIVDTEKVSFNNKISIYKMNTVSLWIGVFLFCLAFVSTLKYMFLYMSINQLSIIVLFFSIGIFTKTYNFNMLTHKLLKH